MLEDLFRPPTWRPVDSVNIWNLLWPSSRLIVLTEPKNIYKSTFPDTSSPKMAKNHEISVYFSTKTIVALCHAPPQLRNSNCAGFQTKEAIELESCKRI